MKTIVITHPCDVDTLAALHAESFAEAWSAEWVGTLMAQPGTFACLAESCGFILVRAAGGEAEVLTLAVIPAARRRGVGLALLGAAAGHAYERHARRLFLEVGCANWPARSLYSGFGFVEVGRRPNYYPSPGGGRQDALIFSVELPRPRVGNCVQLD